MASNEQPCGYDLVPLRPRRSSVVKKAVISALLALLLTGCMGGTAGTGEGPGEEPSDPTTSDTATKDDSGTAQIGDKFAYDDGVVVEIIGTKRTKIPRYAAGGQPGDPMALLTIRVKNGTESKLAVDLATVQVSYGKDGTKAEQVFDISVSGLSGQIAPRRAKSGKYGFAVPKTGMSDVVVEVSPDFEHDSAIFVGAIK